MSDRYDPRYDPRAPEDEKPRPFSDLPPPPPDVAPQGDAYDWYLDLRRYGSVPYSGFGMGLERTVAWICGLPHLREAIPFPRLINRLNP